MRDADIVVKDGVSYVKLRMAGLTRAFPGLVCDNMQRMGMIRLNEFTLRMSKGYAEIQRIRNEQETEHVRQQAADALPAWQRAHAKAEMSKRRSRQQLEERLDNRECRTITVAEGEEKEFNVELFRPLRFDEDLTVRLDAELLQNLISYIVERGFDSELRRPARDPSLPPGVYKRGDAYLVSCPVSDGDNAKAKRRLLTIRSLDDVHRARDRAIANLGGSPV